MYKDKTWLNEQYHDLGLSTREIANQVGCDAETIRHWLIKYSIDRRPATNINYVHLTPNLLEFLDGNLLGDMSAIQERQQSSFVSRTSKSEDYLRWLAKTLSAYGIEQRGQIKKYENKVGQYWLYHSRYYRDLLRIRERWYPDGKKTVPSDINLTPTIVRHWFVDDGSFFHSRGNVLGKVTFATNGFRGDEVQILADKLEVAIKDKPIHVNKAKVGHTLIFSKESVVKSFFDYIGDCPEEIQDVYGYKWPSLS